MCLQYSRTEKYLSSLERQEVVKVHGFGQKLASFLFSVFSFQSFTIFQHEKPPLQAIKTRSSKSRKSKISPKGLTHGFGPEKAISPSFFLGNVGQKNVFYDIREEKKSFLGYKNKKFKKAKNRHFSKGVNPWFWLKIGHFSDVGFFGNIGQENVFYDTLERKNSFLGYKNKKFKKQKN